MRRGTRVSFHLAALFVVAHLRTADLAAQEPVDGTQPGLDASISLDSNHGAAGAWLQFTPAVGYAFNPRWSVAAGVPIYYVSAGATYDGLAGVAGIGDAYGSISLDLSSNRVTFYTTATASARTGNVDKGLGAGQTSWDWTGHLVGELGRVGPFVSSGVGNNIRTGNESLGVGAGTARPVAGVSSGSVAHAETGLEISVWKSVTLTASGYGVFNLNGTVPSDEDETSDHGIGLVLWTQVTPSVDLSLWFSRSLAYADYTTVSVSVTYNWRHPGRPRPATP